MRYSFLICVDVRFPGGTSSAVVNELNTLALRFDSHQVAVVLIESALFSARTPPNAALVEALSCSPFSVYRLDQHKGFVDVRQASGSGSAGQNRRSPQQLHGSFVVVHNPYVALALGKHGGRLSGETGLVICHQPYLDNDGVPYYSVADVMAAMGLIVARSRLVPIGAVSRNGFLKCGWMAKCVAAFDWPNTFDFENAGAIKTPARRRTTSAEDEPLIIGRHSRPDWAKWPATKEEFKQIYQYGSKRRARFLGWGAHCEQLFNGDLPGNWETFRFNEIDPNSFLQDIDLFVYYHHRNWVEGFGRTIPEAMAAGVPCILPPEFAATFGGAALYCAPEDVTSTLHWLDRCRGELSQWSTHVRQVAKESFGPSLISEVYARLSEWGGGASGSFEDVEREIADDQKQRLRSLDRGLALQKQLKLLPDPSDRQTSVIVDTIEFREPARPGRSTDYAIYLDTRSARSDLWRAIELAESLLQAGYEVSLVHVATRTKTDYDLPNPLLRELSPEIAIYGRPGDMEPSYLEISRALIVAGPQHLFGEGGAPLFVTTVRPIVDNLLVLLDKEQPATWYPGTATSLTLIYGVQPKWVLVGLASQNVSEIPDAVEAPELVAFVASRNHIARRDLLRHVINRQTVRRGRIGLADASQWRLAGDGKVAENCGQLPFFAHAASVRVIPEEVRNNPNFHPFSSFDISLARFLEKIDIVTYFPSESANDLMLIPVLRAIQAGVLAVVDGDLEKHFGSAAIYCPAAELAAVLESFASKPEHLVRTALAKARALVLEQLQAKAVAAIEHLSPRSRRAEHRRLDVPASSTPSVKRPEILFVSSNGVGLGHLTRLMAIARRLEHCEPVFLTMSQAFKIVEFSGWPVKYLPFHEVSGCDISDWNQWLQYELEQIIACRPAVRGLVFDGTTPYAGLLAACASTDLRKVWIQRGMWRKGQMNREHVRRGKSFDLIIEPSDIAESLSTEPVESPAFEKVKTEPISLLDYDELLPASKARSALGIPSTQRTCLIQLGSGTNRDIVSLLHSIIPILKQKGITPYIAEWLMGSEIPRIWPGVVHMRIYPIAKYFSAFDFCISAAGYNSFHELIICGRPTIFIANEHQSMDDQLARAQFAMRNDASMLILEEDVHRIGPMIDLIMQEEVRSLMAAACKAIGPVNGAVRAAEVVEALVTDGLSMMPHSLPRAEEQAA